ncbi:MAG: hypothetical protein ACM36C_13350 [Acidobacteriota bacterium]
MFLETLLLFRRIPGGGWSLVAAVNRACDLPVAGRLFGDHDVLAGI